MREPNTLDDLTESEVWMLSAPPEEALAEKPKDPALLMDKGLAPTLDMEEWVLLMDEAEKMRAERAPATGRVDRDTLDELFDRAESVRDCA